MGRGAYYIRSILSFVELPAFRFNYQKVGGRSLTLTTVGLMPCQLSLKINCVPLHQPRDKLERGLEIPFFSVAVFRPFPNQGFELCATNAFTHLCKIPSTWDVIFRNKHSPRQASSAFLPYQIKNSFRVRAHMSHGSPVNSHQVCCHWAKKQESSTTSSSLCIPTAQYCVISKLLSKAHFHFFSVLKSG